MFKCIEAKDEELIKEIYRFRYRIACEEEDIFDKRNYSTVLETDDYDKYSVQYAVLDENEIVGCMRIIHHSPIGYPAFNNLEIYEKDRKILLPNEKMGELSRIFIRKDCRGIKQSKAIIESIKVPTVNKLKEYNIEFTFGALEESFARFLKLLKIPYHKVGPYLTYGNRKRALHVMYTEELYSLNKELFCEVVH
ncbi:GNAT family N-acyltransferase [Hydrogenimonas sp.]